MKKLSDYLDNILTYGFMPYITKPTRVTDHSATLIDHIYGNRWNRNISSGIVIAYIADYWGIFSVIKHPTLKTENFKKQRCRSFSERNYMMFNDIVKSTDFSGVYQADDVDTSYERLMKCIDRAFNKAFPIITKNIPRKFVKRSPWMTRGLIVSSNRRSELLLEKLNRPSPVNINTYKSYNQIYRKMIRAAKAKYYEYELNLARYDVRKTWSLLKSAITKQSYKTKLPEFFIDNQRTLSHKAHIANAFNNYFSNIGQSVSESVSPADRHFSSYLSERSNQNIFLGPVTPVDIFKIIRTMKSKTSLDVDGLSSKLIKSVDEYISLPLTHVINLSLESGIVPN